LNHLVEQYYHKYPDRVYIDQKTLRDWQVILSLGKNAQMVFKQKQMEPLSA